MLTKLCLAVLIALSAHGFTPNPVFMRKTIVKMSNNEVPIVPMPPSAQSIQRLKAYGFTYEQCLFALVRERNNETAAIIYLNLNKHYLE